MRGRIPQIDALRGVAALLVAGIFHVYILLNADHTSPLDGIPPFTWLHVYGHTLVDLFFVISGFIFAHVYLTEGGLNCSARDFAIARFARLYPLHLATLLAVAIMGMLGATVTNGNGWHFVLNLLMLQESGLEAGRSFNSPAWSISVEVFCYVIFACGARLRILPKLAPAMIALGFAMNVGDTGLTDIGRGFIGFFIGVVIYDRRPPLPVIVAALVVAWLCRRNPFISIEAVYSLTLWPALMLLALKTPLSWQWLGDRSYSIYLWHYPVYLALRDYSEFTILWMAGGIVCVLVVADLSFRYMESPARRWIKTLAAKDVKAARQLRWSRESEIADV